MKFKITMLLSLLFMMIVGCAAPNPEIVAVEVEREYAEQAKLAQPVAGVVDMDDSAVAPLEPADGVLPRMIIYNADIDLVVKDTAVTQETITQIVGEWGGYISNAGSYAYDSGAKNINLTLRIPAENFNAAMTALREMALDVSRENINSQDVTQEYVDLESRLSALEVKVKRLETLMEEAEDTEAVLEVYEHLSATQMEIEQTKGQMRYFERSAAMATIQVQLIPDEVSQPVTIAGWRPQGTLKHAVEALIEALQFLVDALIWIIILIVPVILFIAFVIFIFIKILGVVFKRRKRKVAETMSKPGQTTS